MVATSGGKTATGVSVTTTGLNDAAEAAAESVDTRATQRRVVGGERLTFLIGEGCLDAFLLESGSNEILLPFLGDFATLSGMLSEDSATRSPRVGEEWGDTVMVGLIAFHWQVVGEDV